MNNKRQSPLVKAEPIYSNVQDEPIYDNVEIIKQTKKTNIENVKTPSRRTNTPKGTVTKQISFMTEFCFETDCLQLGHCKILFFIFQDDLQPDVNIKEATAVDSKPLDTTVKFAVPLEKDKPILWPQFKDPSQLKTHRHH